MKSRIAEAQFRVPCIVPPRTLRARLPYRVSQLDVVQERVHEFTGAAMRDRFQTLSHQLTGQWPDEWCEALIASTE